MEESTWLSEPSLLSLLESKLLSVFEETYGCETADKFASSFEDACCDVTDGSTVAFLLWQAGNSNNITVRKNPKIRFIFHLV